MRTFILAKAYKMLLSYNSNSNFEKAKELINLVGEFDKQQREEEEDKQIPQTRWICDEVHDTDLKEVNCPDCGHCTNSDLLHIYHTYYTKFTKMF